MFYLHQVTGVLPFGPKLKDLSLLEIIENKRPKFIVINIGGGVQEKLGYYLRTRLDYSPAITCTGAALAF